MRDITNSKGKIFRHFKGDLYLVEDFVKHSETQETMVLYRALYGECGLFVRPYGMFVEEVPEGKVNPTADKNTDSKNMKLRASNNSTKKLLLRLISRSFLIFLTSGSKNRSSTNSS